MRQPGPLHAFYDRTRARRGYGKAIVATARKLATLFWYMLTRGDDYAHQQPSLSNKKLRRLEITAGVEGFGLFLGRESTAALGSILSPANKESIAFRVVLHAHWQPRT